MKKNFIYAVFLGFLAVAGLSFVSCSGKATQSETDTETVKEEAEEEDDMFVCKDGQFKANFPGKPEYSTQMVPTEAGEIEMISYVYEKSATEAYMIAYSDYPSKLIDGQEPMDLLKSARDGSLDGMVMEDNEETKVSSWPAIRTFAIDKAENLYYILEVVMAKNRLYQVLMVRDGTYPSDNAIEDFMDSFVITMKKK